MDILEEHPFLGVGFGEFLETVEIELPDEGLELGVPEVFGEDAGDQLLGVLDDELSVRPGDDLLVLVVLQDGVEFLDEVSHLRFLLSAHKYI